MVKATITHEEFITKYIPEGEPDMAIFHKKDFIYIIKRDPEWCSLGGYIAIPPTHKFFHFGESDSIYCHGKLKFDKVIILDDFIIKSDLPYRIIGFLGNAYDNIIFNGVHPDSLLPITSPGATFDENGHLTLDSEITQRSYKNMSFVVNELDKLANQIRNYNYD